MKKVHAVYDLENVHNGKMFNPAKLNPYKPSKQVLQEADIRPISRCRQLTVCPGSRHIHPVFDTGIRTHNLQIQISSHYH